MESHLSYLGLPGGLGPGLLFNREKQKTNHFKIDPVYLLYVFHKKKSV